jgi:hypothetical protein
MSTEQSARQSASAPGKPSAQSHTRGAPSPARPLASAVVAAVAVAGLSVVPPAHATAQESCSAVPDNLVVNCSFELPAVAAGTFTGIAPGSGLNGWTVGRTLTDGLGMPGDKVDLVHGAAFDGYPVYDAQQSLDLNHLTYGGVYQDVPSTPGEAYVLSFWMSGLPENSIDNCFATHRKTVKVVAGESEQTFEFDPDPGASPLGNQDFVENTLVFTGRVGASTTRVAINSTSSGCAGPVIDNVVVKPFTVAPSLSGEPGEGVVGQDYHFAFEVDGVPDDPRVSTTDPLPEGLALSETGVIEGVPVVAGDFPLTVTADNGVAPIAELQVTLVVRKDGSGLRLQGPGHVANGTPVPLAATLEDSQGRPINGREVALGIGAGGSAQSCTATSNASGYAECAVNNLNQPASATSVSVLASFAGDASYLPSEATGTASILYYTGRAYALSAKVGPLQPTVVSDTGEVLTASESTAEKYLARVSLVPVTATALSSSIVTGDAQSTANAAVGEISINLLGIPAVRAKVVRATSTSACADLEATASGGVTIQSLSIGGVLQSTTNPAPNTEIKVGLATITLNEQKPVPDASAGLMVNAIRVAAPGVADIVVASAKSDIHNCP